MNFFNTFANWPWPTLVLQDKIMQVLQDVIEIKTWMLIKLPCSPYECCHSNVTQSTFTRIIKENFRGHKITKVFNTPREMPFTGEEMHEIRDKWATYFTDNEIP